MLDALQAGDSATVAAELVEDGAQFFAPVSFDLIDSLLSAYKTARLRIDLVAEFVSGPEASSVLHFFLSGNVEPDRCGAIPTAAGIFDPEGAIYALRAHYWAKALQLTDVLDLMPQARRSKWNQQIRNPGGKLKDFSAKSADRRHHPDWFDERGEYVDPANAYEVAPLPDFEDTTVRGTLSGLLSDRALYLAERVDGIFQGLSGEHVTNSPSAFGKRLIIANVSGNDAKEGLVNDLRCVIAKFMGRDEPKHYDTRQTLMKRCRRMHGKWVIADGGALKLRVYLNGNAHLEVHPDMAWRLNQVLASMYPAAIPAAFRRQPKRKAEGVELLRRPLPFSVIDELTKVRPAKERIQNTWPERHRDVPNTLAYYGIDADKRVISEVHDVLRALGGTPSHRDLWWEFDYQAIDVLHEVIVTGCLPDAKSHQFYPTRERLARLAVGFASEGAAPDDEWCEPSAGLGGLAQYMPQGRTICVEVSALHCKVLQAKGFVTFCADFLAWADQPGRAASMSRVVMNPPYDRGQWRVHVEHAAVLVRPGGRLVAILPSSARGFSLPGFDTAWHGPYENEFPGASVSVVILVADRTA